ncbi:glycoside-pentoside-hexuronide (GPH):cation symporter [Scandinavium sp. TWS1a]|uniref:MFS transporter n=1 Tax=Scandinavium tedordense TaxID=2926521 RepID=UPI002165187C|nr:glycoside-pentoside-hexuronide (GPH):cation symporter [Scandinavium tedordense]MCS2169517.1 glycoside-pentoside-hexuronide (GPH):cation symporter [Scandinavium tedordense]
MKSNKLSVREKIGFGTGDCAINLSLISTGMFIYAFYVQVVGISPVDAGWLLLAVRCLDACTDPMMGWVANRYKTRIGHYRHWILLAAIPMGISMYLMFINVGDSYGMKLFWAYSTYIFNSLMFTVVTIPYISMISVITDNQNERITANTWRFSMAKTATLLCTTMVPWLVTVQGGTASAYSLSFVLLGTIGALLLLFCGLTTRERINLSANKTPLLQQMKSALRNDQWVILCSACVTLMLAFLLRANIAFIYVTDFAGAKGGYEVSLFLGMWSIGGVIAAIVSKQLTRRYCKINVFRLSMYLSAAFGIAMYFIVDQDNFMAAVICYLIYCFLTDLNTPIFWALISEVTEYGKQKNGVDTAGLSMGAISFCQKLGMGLSGIVTGYTLSWFGYSVAEEKTASAMIGLSLSLCIAPALFFLITGLIME